MDLASKVRFVVQTWSDQRDVRRVIAEELTAEQRSVEKKRPVQFLLPFLNLGQSLQHRGRICYEAVHERYEQMKARGEVVETMAFCRVRTSNPFAQQVRKEGRRL